MNKIKILLFVLVVLTSICKRSYSQGSLSGDLMLNGNFYQRDTAIGASTTQYLRELSSADAWFSLNYAIADFEIKTRLDFFHNSALQNPQQAYTAQGLGYWSVSKKIAKLQITAGHFYEQFGTGIVFRAYENRGLGTDNALQGILLKYYVNETYTIKAFTGLQKNRFSTRQAVIKGINFEKTFKLNDNINFIPGASLVNRTMESNSMNIIVSNINALPLDDRFTPKYNVYLFSGYTTLYIKNFSWYIEHAGKTSEAIVDSKGKLINAKGEVIFNSFSYTKKGFSADVQYKKTENFTFRTSPNEILLDGVINYLPALTRLNSYRLLSRYNAAAQDLSEKAFQANLAVSPKKGFTISASFADINKLDNTHLYSEIVLESENKFGTIFTQTIGVQIQQFNQQVYEGKINVPKVKTLTPFAEWTYRLNRKNSIRSEIQYLKTKQDAGGWLYGLLEYSKSPKFSIWVTDMYNYGAIYGKKIHYYTFGTSLSANATKFSISYVKQVKGIVCTGGICRLEPAFSGMKISLISSF